MTVLSDTTKWTDYDADMTYGDWTVDEVTGAISNGMAYLPGIGQMDGATGAVQYFHGDQIGTLRAVSAEAGLVSSRQVFTAFGEQVFADGTVGTRYQYAGEYGYETSVGQDAQFAGVPFLHVGHRWYDPATGRFLQRDPIGISGNLNVYAYCGNDPPVLVDPLGYKVKWWTIVKVGVGMIGLELGVTCAVHYAYDKGGEAAERAGTRANEIDIVMQDAAEKNPPPCQWNRVHPDRLSKNKHHHIDYLVRANGDVSVSVGYVDGEGHYYVIDR